MRDWYPWQNIEFPLFVDEVINKEASVFLYSLEPVEGVAFNGEIEGVWGFVPAISCLSLISPSDSLESPFSDADFEKVFNSVYEAGYLVTPVYSPQTIRIPENIDVEPGSVLRLRQSYVERLFGGEGELELDLALRSSDVETSALAQWHLSLIGERSG